MLAKIYRLGRRDLLLVKQQGTRFKHKYFLATVQPSDKPYSRFAVVVSTQVDKRATVRNHLRRFVYDRLDPKVFGSRDLVLHLTPGVVHLSDAEVGAELNSFLSTLPRVS